MGLGAFFLLFVVIVVAVAGGASYFGVLGTLTAKRRARSGDRDLVGDGSHAPRPRHTGVENEERSTFDVS